MGYNPWPLGMVPEHLQRPELRQLKEMGYQFEDAREVVTMFEQKVCDFTGAKYAVSADCCTHALELALRYFGVENKKVFIPKYTYMSVWMMLKHLNADVEFTNEKWTGEYKIHGTNIYDSAVRWKRGMYMRGKVQCLSFQIKKTIPIGRGGMILCDRKEMADALRLASYDGRDLRTPYDDPMHTRMIGHHYYMTPEDAARGIILMDQINKEGDSARWDNYPNLEKYVLISQK